MFGKLKMSAKFTLNNALHLEMSYVEHWSIFGNSLLAFPESIDSVTLSINQRQYNINYTLQSLRVWSDRL